MRIRRSFLREVYETSYIVEHKCSTESPFCGGGLRAAAGRGAGREDLPVNSIKQVMRHLSFEVSRQNYAAFHLEWNSTSQCRNSAGVGGKEFHEYFNKNKQFCGFKVNLMPLNKRFDQANQQENLILSLQVYPTNLTIQINNPKYEHNFLGNDSRKS